MFGIVDPQIWIAYLLAIGFALACMAYGMLYWNRGDDGDGR